MVICKFETIKKVNHARYRLEFATLWTKVVNQKRRGLHQWNSTSHALGSPGYYNKPYTFNCWSQLSKKEIINLQIHI